MQVVEDIPHAGLTSRLRALVASRGRFAASKDEILDALLATRADLARVGDELHTAQAELASAGAAHDAFVYSVSHDLRAPLRAIEGFAAILEEEHGAQLDAAARRLLGIIRE